jgi:hypothetical protein
LSGVCRLANHTVKKEKQTNKQTSLPIFLSTQSQNSKQQQQFLSLPTAAVYDSSKDPNKVFGAKLALVLHMLLSYNNYILSIHK